MLKITLKDIKTQYSHLHSPKRSKKHYTIYGSKIKGLILGLTKFVPAAAVIRWVQANL